MSRFFKLFILLFFFSLVGFSQISKIHYIPPLTANDRGQGGGGSIPYDQYLYLSTPSTSDVSVKITVIKTGQEITYTDLRNDNPIVYQIATLQSPMNGELFVDPDNTGEPALNAGLVVEADCPVYASVRYNAGSQAGALVSKGDASLGTHFRTGMMTTGQTFTGLLKQVIFLIVRNQVHWLVIGIMKMVQSTSTMEKTMAIKFKLKSDTM